MGSTAEAVDPCYQRRVGARVDDRLGPRVEVIEKLVEILAECLDHWPFEFIGADLVVDVSSIFKFALRTNLAGVHLFCVMPSESPRPRIGWKPSNDHPVTSVRHPSRRGPLPADAHTQEVRPPWTTPHGCAASP